MKLAMICWQRSREGREGSRKAGRKARRRERGREGRKEQRDALLKSRDRHLAGAEQAASLHRCESIMFCV
jgi:hypothetical protein